MFSFRIGPEFKAGATQRRAEPAPASEMVFAARARARRLGQAKKATAALALLAAPLLAVQAHRSASVAPAAPATASLPVRPGAPAIEPQHILEANIAHGGIDFTATSATCAQNGAASASCAQPRRAPKAAQKRKPASGAAR